MSCKTGEDTDEVHKIKYAIYPHASAQQCFLADCSLQCVMHMTHAHSFMHIYEYFNTFHSLLQTFKTWTCMSLDSHPTCANTTFICF